GAGWLVHRWRSARRVGRNSLRAVPVPAARRAQYHLCRRRHRGGDLYVGADSIVSVLKKRALQAVWRGEMTTSSESNRPYRQRTRRQALGLLGTGAAAIFPRRSLAQRDDVLTEALVLRDPDIPAAGNPAGDITIVEYFDYQCPYCRKLEPELRQVVQDDGTVRLVFKDWPILGPASVTAAHMVLASKYQDKFIQAHDALIAVNSKLTEARIREVLAGAGIDLDRLDKDLASNSAAIDAVVSRNKDQAVAFEFGGTPSFIVGKFRVPGVLTMAQFGQAIADARKAMAARK